MIQALLLDLLQDVPEAAVEATGIAELVDLLRLSTSFAIQSTAYRILSRVIRSRTLALVLEVEASVAEAEEGQASRTIALPQELEEVVRYGVDVDWHGEVSIPAILGQLLAWMAILDHFDDAVSQPTKLPRRGAWLTLSSRARFAGHISTSSTRRSSSHRDCCLFSSPCLGYPKSARGTSLRVATPLTSSTLIVSSPRIACADDDSA